MCLKLQVCLMGICLFVFYNVSCTSDTSWTSLDRLRRSRFIKPMDTTRHSKRASELETLLAELRKRGAEAREGKSPLHGVADHRNFPPPQYDSSDYEFEDSFNRRSRVMGVNPSNDGIISRDELDQSHNWPIDMSWDNPEIYQPHQNHDTDPEPVIDAAPDKQEASNIGEFRYDVTLDSAGDFRLFWDVDMPTEVIKFRLELRVHKNDLFAFGFSDYGEATDGDLLVMWTDHRGRHLVQDTHTDDSGRLLLDDSQDYDLDDVIVQEGRINLMFHRKFDTCDDQDYMIDGGTTHIIFFTQPGVIKALSRVDVTSVKLGLQRVQLIKSQIPAPALPPDTSQFVMHVDNVEIPAVETTYWFATRQLPELSEKHHIVRFSGVISPGSVGIVHHMEVFHCVVGPGDKLPEFNQPSSSNEGRPKGLETCRQVIGAWAMGAQAVAYPVEAGVPIGGPGFTPYVLVEVHYNNPDRKKGIIDSSGIRFDVTRQLRQYDAGIMEVGVEYTDKLALPPGLPEWDMVGYCIPECTRKGLPEMGIKIFAAQLHTHLTGRTTFTKHYRDGIQLPDINRDNHYSPHYQEIRQLPRPVTVLPGDALVHVCRDRTVGRENVTLGGFAISDEMCVTYVHYYPRTQLEVCKSSVTTSSLYGFFNFLKSYNRQPLSEQAGISDNYKSVDWSPMNIHLLRRFYDTAPLSMQCNQSDGSRFPGNWEGKEIPELAYPLPPTERPCLL